MTELPMLVLAGGFGTRLRSVVGDLPKALAPVDQLPFLGLVVDRWVSQGVSQFVFLLHHQGEMIQGWIDEELAGGSLGGCDVRVVIEREPLGTGGAVANAVHEAKLTGRFLVANADTWLGGGIREIAEAAPPAIAVVHRADLGRYGAVRLDGGRVVEFHEKTAAVDSGWINAGLYHLDASAFSGWDGAPHSLEREVFPRLAREGELVGVRVDAEFVDIGVPEDFFRFCRWVETGRQGAL